MESLDGVSEGCYIVKTESGSVYEVDLDNRTLSRLPNDHAADPNPLRRDRDRVRLLAVENCRVGQRGVFLIDLQLRDVVFTKRRSTAVQGVEALGSGLDDTVVTAEFNELVVDWDDIRPTAGPD